MVSFERVFEVLDAPEPITERRVHRSHEQRW